MKVYVKEFDVEMEIKTKGVELQICDTSDKQIGDLVITKTKLIWCEGKTSRDHGKAVTWEKFREWMKSQ